MTSAYNLKYHNKKCYFTLLFMNESRILDRARHYTHVLRKIARSEYQIIRMACTLTKINLFDLTIRMAQAFLCFFFIPFRQKDFLSFQKKRGLFHSRNKGNILRSWLCPGPEMTEHALAVAHSLQIDALLPCSTCQEEIFLSLRTP